MANYSFWVLGESNISFTGGAELDGIFQGDGRNIVGETMTINSTNSTEVFIRDAGTETKFADNDRQQRLDGDTTIDGVTFRDNTIVEAEYQFVVQDDRTGQQFKMLAVNFVNSSRTYATDEAIAFITTPPPVGVPLRVISAEEGPKNSGPDAIDESLIVPICFAGGTEIETARGIIGIENLLAGDHVVTLEGRLSLLKKVFRTRICRAQLAENPKLRPVRIVAGALGRGLPTRDLVVSRQHRMMLSSEIARRMFGARDVLIPAIMLTQIPGIFVEDEADYVDYFHLLFDRHEVIFANGAPSETLFTGPEALKSVSPQARDEILSMFPELAQPGYTPTPALPIPGAQQQKQLVARHLKNRRQLLASFAA